MALFPASRRPEPDPEPDPEAVSTQAEVDNNRVLTEAEQLRAWEFLMCLDLGFTLDQALVLVQIPGFSWHHAQGLRAKGMPHDLIVTYLEE